jgi:hypothetical protein
VTKICSATSCKSSIKLPINGAARPESKVDAVWGLGKLESWEPHRRLMRMSLLEKRGIVTAFFRGLVGEQADRWPKPKRPELVSGRNLGCIGYRAATSTCSVVCSFASWVRNLFSVAPMGRATFSDLVACDEIERRK